MSAETQIDNDEKEFRKDNLWHSFLASLYSIVAGASFIGVLNNVVSSMVRGGADALALGDPGTMAVMGGFAALGIASTYLAQREYTHLKVIQDDHLARKNALCLNGHNVQQQLHEIAKDNTHAQHHGHEYEHHKRKDGKSWRQAVMADNNPGAQQEIQI